MASVPDKPVTPFDQRIEALVRQSEGAYHRGRQTLEDFIELFEHMSEARLQAYVALGRVPVLREAATAALTRRFPNSAPGEPRQGKDPPPLAPYVPF